ncbi:MAG: amino acid ABC transporter substrate-binding protein [Actinobacteria bacterium]|nr:MAG: amino acid ABC transporter substrate-binding protein [Actinomycetota bacterium]
MLKTANKRALLALVAIGSLTLGACGSSSSSADTTAAATPAAIASGTGNECTAGLTLADGKLTIGTGNPAFSPWVENDAPESGEGFEAAVAYAVATAMGYDKTNVAWVRTSFDEAIQPGAKSFDFNLQQYSITNERKQTVTFSDPYYSTNQAIVGFADSAAVKATTLAQLQALKFGVQSGTTSLDFVNNVIHPTAAPYVYDDNVAAKAALEAKQIDAIVVDLPTAFYISAVEIAGSKVIGQFPAPEGTTADQFGMVLDLNNPLVDCVNHALAQIKDSGELAAIEKTWLADKTSAPVIEVG